MEIGDVTERDRPAILEIIDAAAGAYRDVIPAGRRHYPYMPAADLDPQIETSVALANRLPWTPVGPTCRPDDSSCGQAYLLRHL